MNVHYDFRFQDGCSVEFKVTDKPSQPSGPLPSWTKLEHCQCSNCPLNTAESPHCPAATEILPVVEAFRDEDAYQKVGVKVTDDRRSYLKQTALQVQKEVGVNRVFRFVGVGVKGSGLA